ncbi:hypothetical protein OAB00_00995 [Akkermansiaceae bacterium]|nr:hypothetical protein [Akkermansiaceae bacterium]
MKILIIITLLLTCLGCKSEIGTQKGEYTIGTMRGERIDKKLSIIRVVHLYGRYRKKYDDNLAFSVKCDFFGKEREDFYIVGASYKDVTDIILKNKRNRHFKVILCRMDREKLIMYPLSSKEIAFKEGMLLYFKYENQKPYFINWK